MSLSVYTAIVSVSATNFTLEDFMETVTTVDLKYMFWTKRACKSISKLLYNRGYMLHVGLTFDHPKTEK